MPAQFPDRFTPVSKPAAGSLPPGRRFPSTIAIDGPAASGKTTLALLLARQLGYLFFDTGVMYRAITWAALNSHVDVDDEPTVCTLAEQTQIDVRPASKPDERINDILVNHQDVTWDIRTKEVEANVSVVAAYPGVRKALGEAQRKVGLRGRIVMVGRDIGTVILPEAELKIYLDASPEERAHRRYKELVERGQQANYEELLAAVLKRDEIDSNRAVSPLRPAKDARVLVSDGKSIDQVLAEALVWVFEGV